MAAGVLKGGDTLPSIRKMAELCGTSVRVPLAAVGQLQKDGILEAHPRLGIRVLRQKRKLWKGRVLIVSNGGNANYFVNALNAEVATMLTAADYRVEFAFVIQGMGSRDRYAVLRKMLCDDYDLVVFPAYDHQVFALVKRSSRPYLVYATADFSREDGCIGVLSGGFPNVIRQFLEQCDSMNVRNVLQMRFRNWEGPDLTDDFRKLSIGVENLEIPLSQSPDRLDEIGRVAFEALSRRIADKKRRLPELIFFADDFIARGGLWALTNAGLRAPEDVKIVTVANKGFLPAYSRSLTRLETDTFVSARLVADRAIGYLERGAPPKFVVMKCDYVRGVTF